MLLGYEQIDFYGFEMGTTTEYHYQRANFEYLVGVAHGLGFNVVIPERSPILKGELYGYENMQQGYRQNLEMRKVFLEQKQEKARAEMFKTAGAVQFLQVLLEKEKEINSVLRPHLDTALKTYHNDIALVNIYAGALNETKNLTGLYDGYFRGGVESTRSDESLVNEFVRSGYGDDDE